MQKNGSNYLLENWNTEDEPEEVAVTAPWLIHPSGRPCSKNCAYTTKQSSPIQLLKPHIMNDTPSGTVVHPSGRPCSKWSKRIQEVDKQMDNKQTKNNMNRPKVTFTVATVDTKQTTPASDNMKHRNPTIHHKSGCICSKQNVVSDALTVATDQETSVKQIVPVTWHLSGCVCSKQWSPNVPVTIFAPEPNRSTWNSGRIIHPSGRLCRKQHTRSTALPAPEKKISEAVTGLLLLNVVDNSNDVENELDTNASLMAVDAPPKPDLIKEIDQDIENSTKQTADSEGTEIYSEPEELDTKDIDSDKSPKGQLVTRKYGLKRKNARQRKYTCTICGVERRSACKIDEHHQESHEAVNCDICGKECSTPLSLEWHRYSHNVKPFICDICIEGFQFASELNNHRIKHRKIKTFICAYPKCGKSFMRNSELTVHSTMHTGTKYVCPCNKYETTDKRLYRQHQRTHSDEKRYACKICGERFKHTTQVIWHTNDKHWVMLKQKL